MILAIVWFLSGIIPFLIYIKQVGFSELRPDNPYNNQQSDTEKALEITAWLLISTIAGGFTLIWFIIYQMICKNKIVIK